MASTVPVFQLASHVGAVFWCISTGCPSAAAGSGTVVATFSPFLPGGLVHGWIGWVTNARFTAPSVYTAFPRLSLLALAGWEPCA